MLNVQVCGSNFYVLVFFTNTGRTKTISTVEIVFVLPVFVLKCLHSLHPMSYVLVEREGRWGMCAEQQHWVERK